ncbi:MAG: hypothetical protein U0790_14350 [Isosphaeraceae bacterium]
MYRGSRPSLRAALLLLALGAVSGCYVPPGTSLNNHYHTPLPAGVKVLHYYSDAYKDPQFLWVLEPVEEDFLKKLIAGAKLQPAPEGQPPARLGVSLAPWWDAGTIETIPEVYFRDPDPSDGSYYRVWVDRKNNRLYVLFMNT